MQRALRHDQAAFLAGGAAFLLIAATLPAAPREQVHYSKDVRPILSNNCFACHGPDDANRKAKLRLDTFEGATVERRDGTRAVTPGDPAKSAIIERITATDDLDVMPPTKTGKKLSDAQKQILKQWIKQGARYDTHWSYTPPRRTSPPQPKDNAWPTGHIDRFLQARFEEEGVAHAVDADRRTLLRRLSFDLTGLPPTPDEVKAFEADTSPDAFARQVERLLASPHYGERMAQYWLDLVRYADTTGYHGDNDQVVWPFRDYVINAFNDNKPFDVFTQEQLAGDLLPDSGPEQKVASGYNRLNLTTREGGAQPKEYVAKYFADRVRNVSSVWLASTMGCCECHTHKYDPFTIKDFYSLGAFFTDLAEVPVGEQPPGIRLPSSAQKADLQRLDRQIAPLEQQYNADTPEFEAALAAWEKDRATKSDVRWTPLAPLFASSRGGATLGVQGDTVLAGGKLAETDTYVLGFYTEATKITGVRLEALTNPAFPAGGPGRAGNGNFVLHEFKLGAAPAEAPGKLRRVPLQNASADFSQDGFDVAGAIDGNPATGWAVMPKFGVTHNAIFETKKPLGSPGGTVLTVTMDQMLGTAHVLGQFRISITTDANPAQSNGPAGVPADIRAILLTSAGQRKPEQKQALRNHFRSVAPHLAPIRDRIAQLRAKRDEVERGVATMLIAQSIEPRVARVLARGNWMDDSGEVVQPAVPAFLPQPTVKDRRLTRLDLANWMIARDNPLVARVFVNRLWYLFFGQGLVKSLDDFGSQGAWPSNPELLDWLAAEFVDSGWDVKHMVRLIVSSHAYRQSSKPTPEQLQHDPANQLFARQGRFRLDAEFIRDEALAISGLFVPRLGGPSVRPYQPAGYYSFLNFPLRDYTPDRGDNQYRRGLYTWWQRMFLHPSLKAFDAPSHEECTAERVRSNTPLQALVLLNDPTYVEAARVFAARMLADTPGQAFDRRLSYVFQRTLQREPKPKEAELLAALCRKHMTQYQQDPSAAAALLKVGDAPPGAPDQNAAEVAAWTSVTRAVLNLHETITRN